MSYPQICPEDPRIPSMRVSATYTACVYSVLVYDWLSSLSLERKYIWQSRPSTVTVLYGILRYWTLMKFAISIYLSNTWMSYDSCHRWAPFQVNSNLVITVCASSVLALRLYALYDRSKVLLGALGVSIATMVTVAAYASKLFDAPHFLQDVGPCFASAERGASTVRISMWIGPFVYDSLALLLLLARALVMKRKGASLSSDNILAVMVRDGLFYFGAISMANLINVFFLTLAPLAWQTVNAGMAFMISSLVSCRMVLSLRGHADGNFNYISSSHQRQDTQSLKNCTSNRAIAAQAATGAAHGLPVYPEPNVIPLEQMPGLHKISFSDEGDCDRRSAPGVCIVTEKSTVVEHADKV